MAPKRKKTSPGSKRKGDAGSVATTSTVIMAPKRKKTGPGSRKKGDAGSVATTSTVLPSEDTTGNLNQAPLDVQALTRTITSSVTEAVMANLRNAGLLPAADQEQPALTSGREVSSVTPIQPPRTNVSSCTFPTRELACSFNDLLNSALAPSTKTTYTRAWEVLNTFSKEFYDNSLKLPLSVDHISIFVAYLYHECFAPKTMSTYLSAIAYAHKIGGYPDPTSTFLVNKLVAGAYRLQPSVDLRLPITVPILDKLITALQHTTPTTYDKVLFEAMFLFAFNAFARIGEITIPLPSATYEHVIQFSDLLVHYVADKPTSISVAFRIFKHNVTGRSHTIKFLHGPSRNSAVQAIVNYINMRGNYSGSLFCRVDRAPVHRHFFDSVLRRTLNFCRLDSARYKGHSFRIGAASLASDNGLSDSQIRSLGRWKSNAFKKYVRSCTT